VQVAQHVIEGQIRAVSKAGDGHEILGDIGRYMEIRGDTGGYREILRDIGEVQILGAQGESSSFLRAKSKLSGVGLF
jgi:hypothetical protein